MSSAHKCVAVGASVLVMVFASALAVAKHSDPGPIERNPGEVGEQEITSSPVTAPAVTRELPKAASTPPVQASAPNYHLDWWSVNSGGVTRVAGANYGLGVSVGQAATGYVSGTYYNLGFGFWYGAVARCPMTLFGDVDASASISPADIIYIVNFIFKAGPDPLPCIAAADVDCSGGMSSADIIHMVNYIFKAGPPPCNTCTSSLAGDC